MTESYFIGAGIALLFWNIEPISNFIMNKLWGMKDE